MDENLNFDFNGQEMLDIVRNLCEFGYRRAGTPPADKAELYLYDKLKETGLPDVKLEEINYTRWWPEKYELTILSEHTPGVSKDQVIETFPAWFSDSTPKEGFVAEVIYVGYGTKSEFNEVDVNGKIALIDGKMVLNFFPTHNERLFDTVGTAKKMGALAVICTNGSPLDSITYMSPSPSIDGFLPFLSISTPDGIYLKHLCTRFYKKLVVKFTLHSKKGPATSNTIIGRLPGKSEDVILIGTHTDSTFTGALDNAAANAALIILARHYVKIPLEKREKTLLFVGWTGHECGSIGSKLFVQMHEDILPKITTFVLLDGFGCNEYYNQADGAIVPTNLDERRGLFVSENAVLLSFVLEAVLKYQLMPAAYVSARSLPAADLPPFIAKEVPSILIIGKPILYHTKLDTIDIIKPDQLERSLKAHIEIIDQILSTPSEKIKTADGKLTNLDQFITQKEGLNSPQIMFHVIPEVLVAGGLALFIPSVFVSPKGILLSIKWEFEDGMTSDRIIMIRSFRKAGSYKVRLKVTDNFGNIGIQERIIRVVEKYRKSKEVP